MVVVRGSVCYVARSEGKGDLVVIMCYRRVGSIVLVGTAKRFFGLAALWRPDRRVTLVNCRPVALEGDGLWCTGTHIIRVIAEMFVVVQ